MLTLLLASCADDNAEPRPTLPPETATTSSSVPAIEWDGGDLEPPDWVCSPARDPDYTDWPGGQRMRLEVGDIRAGAPLSLAVSGADPGERVVFHIGELCALDCPVQLDGACFQPALSSVLAEGVADAAGNVALDVTPDGVWWGRWIVLQATAPDASSRYLSQPLVDRSGPWTGPLLPEEVIREMSPATVRGLRTVVYEQFSWPIGPGRRAQLTVLPQSFYLYDNEPEVWMTSESVSTRGVDDGLTDGWFPATSRWSVETAPSDANYPFSLDLRLLPTDAPVEWYPDTDGDGYGDPSGAPVASTVPVPRASPAATDCDDGDPALSPAGAETCGDGIDQDCDGVDRACQDDPATAFELGAAGTRVAGEPFAEIGTQMLTGDLDGDGRTELIAPPYGTIPQSGVIVELGRTDVGPADTWTWPEGLGGGALAVADLTGDGRDDLVALQWDRQWDPPIAIYGEGPSAASVTLSTDDPLMGTVLVGELTGDGRADLLVTTSLEFGTTGWLLFGDVATQQPSASFAAPSWLGAVGDLDGDGVDDLVTGDGCARFGPLPTDPTGCQELNDGPASAVAVGDVDGDGLADAIVADEVSTSIVGSPWPGAGAIAGAAWAEVHTPEIAQRLWWIPDLDGPGAGRLAIGSWEGGRWTVPVSGPGTFDAGVDGRRLSRSYDGALAGGDFDGDGSVDLAIGEPQAQWDDLQSSGVVWVLWGE